MLVAKARAVLTCCMVLCFWLRMVTSEEIIRRNHLDLLLRYFEECGCEALVLGCTHFPYVSEALRNCTSLPLIDPAEDMVRLLLADSGA